MFVFQPFIPPVIPLQCQQALKCALSTFHVYVCKRPKQTLGMCLLVEAHRSDFHYPELPGSGYTVWLTMVL